ncbi:hypothetical protein [Thermobispora bispora]|uniref:hypothetical protein n=1 Tax=Thermobispora bispora TaxID=2006 RepID=UPI001981107E|nr:hypothetical protein [Thermobispora bispora]QSI46781.1 hypothetical protein CYL17_02095 [Thermobispora bispora]
MTDQHRRALITGLRDLASFLEANPAIPLPHGPVRVTYVPERGDDAEMRAEIDRIAALLKAPIDSRLLARGHYVTGRDFGPVRYEAVAIFTGTPARPAAPGSVAGCAAPGTGDEGPARPS